ncbi:MAG: hypothetical protein J7M20_07575 [Deltaproteobacteria bacterium]|nr:hypothetical protein [Deltaproteobacteria bacterium]
MLINWFTVLAQIVNFLILIYLLKRFLFKPILRVMAEREKNMADALNRAEQAEQTAKARARELEKEKAAFAKARDQVAQWREGTVKEARDEVEALRGAWMSNITRDRQAFLDGLKQRMVEQVVRIGGKVIRDLADQGLNRQVLRVFLEKVADGKDELSRNAMKRGIVVQSGIPLEDDDVRIVRERLSQWFPGVTRIQFESAPELGFGIQLVVGDRKTAWHLTDYLRDLEKEIMGNLFKNTWVKS